MKTLIILLTLIMTPVLKADVVHLKIGPVESYIEYSDWSMSTTEKVYMGIHFIDVLQTINHGKDPCYVEADPITRRLIGRHPNTEKVLAWGVANAVVSHYSFKFVENSNMPNWLKNTLKIAATAIRYDVIHNNWSIGINLYGNNSHHRGDANIQACARSYNF